MAIYKAGDPALEADQYGRDVKDAAEFLMVGLEHGQKHRGYSNSVTIEAVSTVFLNLVCGLPDAIGDAVLAGVNENFAEGRRLYREAVTAEQAEKMSAWGEFIANSPELSAAETRLCAEHNMTPAQVRSAAQAANSTREFMALLKAGVN